jgi:hypothetical protein
VSTIEKEADYELECSCGAYKIVSGYEVRKRHFTTPEHAGHRVVKRTKIGEPK